ncbi:M1 family aminopeptidase [Maricaulis sp.]|uniref:M1 family aminopeptidase n=1 Tax=Maricaulis sp. TaxID=1486257 RepID=UPI0026370974|nr:M1 family aminopeptidase [Maricaulis sp.]
MTRFPALLSAVLMLLAGLAPAAQTQARFHYAGALEFNPDAGTLSADWHIDVLEADLEALTFLLNRNLGPVEIDGPDVVEVRRAEVEGFNGTLASYTIILRPAGDGRARRLAVRYSGELLPEPLPYRINTLDAQKIELTVDSFWMPFDQRFNSLVTADFDIRIDGAWSGVAMQSLQRTADGFRLVQDRPALDIAFTLMSRFRLQQTEAYRIYDLREGEQDLTALIDALDFCTGYLNNLAGPAGPLPSAGITVTGRDGGGYSRATLIALTDISDTSPERLTQFICHELAHYWSRGNPMTVENWLNEGFADHIANMALRAAHGEAAYEARLGEYRERLANSDDALPPIWRPGQTERPPYLVAYRKAPVLLAELEDAVGRDAFARFIARMMREETATTPAMLDALQAEAGVEARTRFEARLGEPG